MNLKNKTNFWVEHKLITREQQREILNKEDKQFLPFILFGMIWLSVCCLAIGVFSFIQAHWAIIPNWLKITGFLAILTMLILTLISAFKNHKKMIFEIALFVSFLMIGGGIGLCAQLFDLPLMNHQGMLLWALLSFIIVFISKKEFLFLLWIPLFLGGLLGFLKLELLLLFFEQSPIFSTSLIAGILLLFIYTTRNFENRYFLAGYKWAVALYILIVFLGDRAMPSVSSGFLLFCFFILLLLAFSIKERRVYLYNLIGCCIILRLVFLYMELSSDKHITALGFLIFGASILLLAGAFMFIEKKLSRKSLFLLKNRH